MNSRKPKYVTSGGLSALAVPAVAGAATHYTTPWYIAVPILVVVVIMAIVRRSRGGRGGPFSKG